MTESTPFRSSFPVSSTRDALTEVLHQGARELLAVALQVEIQASLDAHADLRDTAGRRLVTRTGFRPEREIQVGIGPVPVQQPRIRDQREHPTDRFRSKLLPPYLRRAKCHRLAGRRAGPRHRSPRRACSRSSRAGPRGSSSP